MPASEVTPEAAVVAADPTEPFEPRPLISEVLRTRHCIQGSIFLVEGIDAHLAVSKRYRTVRLLLGDGELCIQALLRSEMHRFVDIGRIFVGCYVRLSSFNVQSVAVDSDADHDSDGAVEMVYLVIKDMTTVGWNTAYMQMAGTTGQEESYTSVGPQGEDVELASGRQNRSIAATRPQIDAPELDTPDLETTYPSTANKAEGPDSDEEDAFESRQVSEQTIKERRQEAELRQQPLGKPLKLTPLKAIPHLPYKQNWAVNVLAVVTWLSDVEPALLPGYVGKQRMARLADPSTDKQVLLTVFLDPDGFAPAIGSVVLLLGVKNHRFDGGSLKKYGNERPKPGTNWWFEDPADVGWCDVEGLKSWWKGPQAVTS
ncbi:hypothetical protein KVR01_009922 [Diaporthe batatas]|uniref:uncharacterized protein n=1 Tax=Diaporthe batatas TaxID=748121 RepID=UPI001D044E99|nr:uncharacterized protein KVR01_009922 [Diaporthe batatas]KAG8160386.1 hypothetical protein KVR01_009922 [Diaporthe batatas]